jgi:excisionase family DNA binding protein
MPGLRAFSPAIELVLWLGLLALCVTALASVQTVRSADIARSIARAAVYLAGQSVDSALSPGMRWMSLHETRVAVATFAVAVLAWLLVTAQAVLAIRRALEPRPRLGDWWVYKPGRGRAPGVSHLPAPSVEPTFSMDVRTAAAYLGVSKATVYRWARAGRLEPEGVGEQLQFKAGDVAALAQDAPRRQHA